jgi:Amidase
MSAGNIRYMNLQMDKLSATGLVRAYRRRELSPVEVTRAVLQRIERLNPHYNAFCVVDADEALRAAMQSEARRQKNEPLSFKTVEKIRSALEKSGIEFIEENGGGPGVRLRKRHQRKS